MCNCKQNEVSFAPITTKKQKINKEKHIFPTYKLKSHLIEYCYCSNYS